MTTLCVTPAPAPNSTRTTYRSRPKRRDADLDMLLEEISPGWAVISTRSRPVGTDTSMLLANQPCTTLIEFALAAAVQSKLAPGSSFTVAEFSVTAEGVAVPRRARLRATAYARAVSRRHVLAEGTVSCGQGEVVLRAGLLAHLAP